MSRRRRKPPRNPISMPLAVVSSASVVIVGLCVAFGLDELLDGIAIPLLLICMLFVIVYTGFAIAQGRIAIVGHVGQIYHFERASEPIVFWWLALAYLGTCGASAAYLAARSIGLA